MGLGDGKPSTPSMGRLGLFCADVLLLRLRGDLAARVSGDLVVTLVHSHIDCDSLAELQVALAVLFG